MEDCCLISIAAEELFHILYLSISNILITTDVPGSQNPSIEVCSTPRDPRQSASPCKVQFLIPKPCWVAVYLDIGKPNEKTTTLETATFSSFIRHMQAVV